MVSHTSTPSQGLMADMQPPSTPYHVVAQRQNILQDATSRLASTLTHESQWQEQRAEELAQLSRVLEQLKQQKSSKSTAATPAAHRHIQGSGTQRHEQQPGYSTQLPAASTWLAASPPTTPSGHKVKSGVGDGAAGVGAAAAHKASPEARLLEDANQLFSRFHQELEAELSQLAGHATSAHFTASAMKAHAEEVLARTAILHHSPGISGMAGAPAGPASGLGGSPLAQLSQKFAAAGTGSSESGTVNEGTAWTRRLQALFDEIDSEDGASIAASVAHTAAPSKSSSLHRQQTGETNLSATTSNVDPYGVGAGVPSAEESWGTAFGVAPVGSMAAAGAAGMPKPVCSTQQVHSRASSDIHADQVAAGSSRSAGPASWQGPAQPEGPLQQVYDFNHQTAQQLRDDANNSPPPYHKPTAASPRHHAPAHLKDSWPGLQTWRSGSRRAPDSVDDASPWAKHAASSVGATYHGLDNDSREQEARRGSSQAMHSSDKDSQEDSRESSLDSESEQGSVHAVYTRIHSRVTEAAQQLSSLTQELQALRQAAQQEAVALQATRQQRQQEEERLEQLLSQHSAQHAYDRHGASQSTKEPRVQQATPGVATAVAVVTTTDDTTPGGLVPVAKPHRVRRRAKRQAVRRSVSCSDITAALQAAAGAMKLTPAVALHAAMDAGLPTSMTAHDHDHALRDLGSSSSATAKPDAGTATEPQQGKSSSAGKSSRKQSGARGNTQEGTQGQLIAQQQTQAELLQELSMLQAQALEARNHLAALSKDQLAAAAQVTSDQAQLASLQAELSLAQAELTAVLQEVALAREQAQQHAQAAQEAGELLGSHQAEQQQSQAALDAATAQLADTQAQQQAAAAQLAETSTQLKAVQQEVETLQEKLTQLTKEREEVQHQHQELTVEVQQLQSERDSLRQGVQQLQEQQVVLQTQQEPLQQSIQQLQAQQGQLQQQVQDLEGQQAGLHGCIRQLQAEKASQQEDGVALRLEKSGLQEEIGKLYTTRRALEQQLQTEKEASQQQVRELSSQREQLQQAVQALVAEQQEISHALAAARSEVTACFSALATLPHASAPGYGMQASFTPGQVALLPQLQATPVTVTPFSNAGRPATAAQQLLSSFAAAAAAAQGGRQPEVGNSTTGSGSGLQRSSSVTSLTHALKVQQELQLGGLQAQITALLNAAAASDAAAAEARQHASAAEEERHQMQLQVVRDKAAHAAIVAQLEQAKHERDGLQASLQAAQAARRNAELQLAEKEQLLSTAQNQVQQLQQQAADFQDEHEQLQAQLQYLQADLVTAKEKEATAAAKTYTLSRRSSSAATQTVALSHQTAGTDAYMVEHHDTGTQPEHLVAHQHKGVQTLRQQMVHSWCQTARLDDETVASLSTKGPSKLRMVHSWCQTVSTDEDDKASIRLKQADVLDVSDGMEAAKQSRQLSTADLALAAASVELERVQCQVAEQQGVLQQLQVEAREATQQLAQAQQQYQQRQQQLAQESAEHLAATRSEQQRCEEALEFAATELSETLAQQKATATQLADTRAKQQAAAAQLADTRAKQQAATLHLADTLTRQQTLQQQLDDLQQEVGVLKGQRGEMQQSVAKAQADVEQLREEHAKLQRAVKQLQQQQQALEAQAPDQLQLQAQHSELQRGVQELQAQQQGLQERCAALQVQHAGLQQESSRLQGAQEELNHHVHHLRREAVDLQHSLEQQRAEHDSLLQQVGELRSHRDQLQQAVQELASEHQDATHALSVISLEVAGCLNALSSLSGLTGPSSSHTMAPAQVPSSYSSRPVAAAAAAAASGPAPTSPNMTPESETQHPAKLHNSPLAPANLEFEFAQPREISLGGAPPVAAAADSPGRQVLQQQVAELQAQVAALLQAAAASGAAAPDVSQVASFDAAVVGGGGGTRHVASVRGSQQQQQQQQQQLQLVVQEQAAKSVLINQLEQVQSEKGALQASLQAAQAARRSAERQLVEKEQLLTALTERVDAAVHATHQQRQLVGEQLHQQQLREAAFDMERAQLHAQLQQLQAAASTAQAAMQMCSEGTQTTQVSPARSGADVYVDMGQTATDPQAGPERMLQQHASSSTDTVHVVSMSTQTAAVVQRAVATSMEATCVRDTGTQPEPQLRRTVVSTQTDMQPRVRAIATQTLPATHTQTGTSTDTCMVADCGIQADITTKSISVTSGAYALGQAINSEQALAAASVELERVQCQVAEQQGVLQQLQIEAREATQQLAQAQQQYQQRQLEVAQLVSAQQDATQSCAELTLHSSTLRTELLSELSDLRAALRQAGAHWGKQQGVMQTAFTQLQSECEQLCEQRAQLLADGSAAKQTLQHATEGLRAAVSFWQVLGALQQACTLLVEEGAQNTTNSNAGSKDTSMAPVLKEKCEWVLAQISTLLSLYRTMEQQQQQAETVSGRVATLGSESSNHMPQMDGNSKVMVSQIVQTDAPSELPDLQQLQSALQFALGTQAVAVQDTVCPGSPDDSSHAKDSIQHMGDVMQDGHVAPMMVLHELIAACGELRTNVAGLQQRYNYACVALCSLYQHTKKLYLFCQASARLLYSEVLVLGSPGHAQQIPAGMSTPATWVDSHPLTQDACCALAISTAGQVGQPPCADSSISAAADKCRAAWGTFGTQLLRLLKHAAHGVKQSGAATTQSSSHDQLTGCEQPGGNQQGLPGEDQLDASPSKQMLAAHMGAHKPTAVDQCIRQVVTLASQLQHSLQPAQPAAAAAGPQNNAQCSAGNVGCASAAAARTGAQLVGLNEQPATAAGKHDDAASRTTVPCDTAPLPPTDTQQQIAQGTGSAAQCTDHAPSLFQQPTHVTGSDAPVSQAELNAALEKLGLAGTRGIKHEATQSLAGAPGTGVDAMQGPILDTSFDAAAGQHAPVIPAGGTATGTTASKAAELQQPAAAVGPQQKRGCSEGANGSSLLARVQQMRHKLQQQQAAGRSVSSSPRTSVPSTPASVRKIISLNGG